MAADLSSLTEFASRYVVCAFPVGHIDFDVFAVTVEWRGASWAVCRGRRCYSARGGWDLEQLPSNRSDSWLTEHRFTLDEALTIARSVASTVVVNGRTVEDVLAGSNSDEQ